MCWKVQDEGGGGWIEEGVITEPAAAGFALLSEWCRVAYCNGQKPRPPSSKANRTARLTSSGLCLSCSLQAPSEKCWHTTAWLWARVLRRGLQACYLCAGFALLELLPCVILGGFSSPCFQQKSHGCCWVTTVYRVQTLSVHAAAECYGAETWKTASRDLAAFFQTSSSFTETRWALRVWKNSYELFFLCSTALERDLRVTMEKKPLLMFR